MYTLNLLYGFSLQNALKKFLVSDFNIFITKNKMLLNITQLRQPNTVRGASMGSYIIFSSWEKYNCQGGEGWDYKNER